ncbi:spore germination protein [Bacillus shivajii]|uniref:GerAB/ArcD/ProY family transporter n=1 Tax=Bacillus shivajii TaxID=1983719 RepID=UPI001CFADB28|nr:GerAB/ArcD/ProY family transporter [Bacillus shivajii]UCZ51506.1 spore germination protein [Bacillus shivajii]
MKQIHSMNHVSPKLVFFLIHTSQIGVGILMFTRFIAEDAGYQAWIGVFLTGAFLHLIIWMMYRLLNRQEKVNDLVKVHSYYFGKKLGAILSFLLIVYFFASSLTVLRTYIEIIQIWMFPQLYTLELGIPIVLLAVYCIWQGFRVVTGIAFLGVIIPLWLIFTIAAPLEFANLEYLLPLFQTTFQDQLSVFSTMTLSFLGLEALLIYYPYIQQGKQSQKWAHFGHLFTTVLYVTVAIVSFLFYTESHLERLVYPTLSMWKILELPFIERFEYIGISVWLFVVFPNITIFLWAASRAMKQTFKITQKKALILLAGLLVICLYPLETRTEVVFLKERVSMAGFYLIYVYIPTLFIITALIHKWRNRSNGRQKASI